MSSSLTSMPAGYLLLVLVSGVCSFLGDSVALGVGSGSGSGSDSGEFGLVPVDWELASSPDSIRRL